MGTVATRTTIYLDTALHKALRLKAVDTNQSISKLVNSAIKESLAEDVGDIEAFALRAKERLVSHDAMIKRLKKDGRIKKGYGGCLKTPDTGWNVSALGALITLIR